ncbi:hypothetical protein K432DRAFT_321677 [Lepidopterella palustris CBS 459.81]|uniref:CBF1-interacting co-repressor CIR N-terminal domain-containing protein n=1 Tax=Lepidopterella palustris CBS 459.81 TaxID=1314670 RepID=A0A8E2JID4_9PEZI|nr:hypothetical protein K432DRAFT_321677 [Lepidopterella palustris CBS 459.81]
MPLHLLGKKSWNVYNPTNIARVRADEQAAAAREAAEEQRMQELDAERRIAFLRGVTPPPLPLADTREGEKGSKKADKRPGHDRKCRRLAGENDTDRDIRLAKTVVAPREDEDEVVLKQRKPTSDAPLTDHAGHINLFPVDERDKRKNEKNAEAEAEKRKKERELEDQYTMRFSNAAGRGGLEKPWYTVSKGVAPTEADATKADEGKLLEFSSVLSKDVWGNEDPRRREREKMRITTSDPFAFMQKAQYQLKKAERDRKNWAEEREREVRELRAIREREDRRERHGKKKKKKRSHGDDDLEGRTKRTKRPDDEDTFLGFSLSAVKGEKHEIRQIDNDRSSKHRYYRGRSRSRERRHEHSSSHRGERNRSERRRSRSPGPGKGRETHYIWNKHREDQASNNGRRFAFEVTRV